MKIKKLWLSASSIVAGLLTVTAVSGIANASTIQSAPAQAQLPSQAAPHPVRISGKLTSVTSNTIVLATGQGDVTANVNSNTWIVTGKNANVQQSTLTDLVTGKTAVVAGMTTSTANVVDARIVAQGAFVDKALAGRAASGRNTLKTKLATGHVAAGTVTAVNGTSITLKGDRVPVVVVQTSADTVVLNNGFVAVSTIKVGDQVQVFGSPVKQANTPSGTPTTPSTRSQIPTSRTVSAWAIHVVGADSTLVVGRVQSVSGNTLIVKTPSKRSGITVTVDASTQYKVATVANKTITFTSATESNISAGSTLLIEGSTSADGRTIAARAVIVLQLRPSTTP